MSEQTITNTIEALDAGIFATKAAYALKDVALGVMATGKKGKLIIKLDLEQLGDTTITIDHTLEFSKPTKNGKTNEINSTSTSMYVSPNGLLTIAPVSQTELFPRNENVTQFKGKR